MRNTFKVVIMVVAVVAMCSPVMAQRPVVRTSPPQLAPTGFGRFLCSGPGCWDGPTMPPFGGVVPNGPEILSRSASYYGAAVGDRVSSATLNTYFTNGGYSEMEIEWSKTEPYPVTPVLQVDLVSYDDRPTDEVIEVSFSGTPWISMEAIDATYGSVGLAMATDCRVLENTACSCNWDPAIDSGDWDTAAAQVCTGITRSGSPPNYTYQNMWFFSVYPSGTGLTQTYAVSYHGFVRIQNECSGTCAYGPMRVAKVRAALEGYGLENTGDPSQYYNHMWITSPHLMVNY